MKKICICTTVASTMESFVVETAKKLYQTGEYDITLICSNNEKFAKSLPEYLNYIPVEMPRGIQISGFKSIGVLRKIFKDQRFDMVQYSTPNASCYASIAAKMEKVPIRLYCQWGIRYVGLSGISRIIFKFLEKVVCRNSTHIRAVSRLNKAFAVKEGLYKESKAEVVGNGGTIGVDTLVFDINNKAEWRDEIRKRYNLSDGDFVYGFAGRISRDKGCAELLQAFLNVSDSSDKARLLVVGPYEVNGEVDDELIAKARECDKIVFTGRVDNSEMKKYYSAMDVLVHPTYREGFGMVIQEAGALAVPTITTKIPGASEVMVDGSSCILVDAKSVSSLQDAMENVLDSEKLVISLGSAAHKRTKELYDRPVMLEHQIKAYQKLVNGEK